MQTINVRTQRAPQGNNPFEPMRRVREAESKRYAFSKTTVAPEPPIEGLSVSFGGLPLPDPHLRQLWPLRC